MRRRLRGDKTLGRPTCQARSAPFGVCERCQRRAHVLSTAKLESEGKIAPRFHATSRPIPAEREATHRACALAEVAGVPVVIVHVSNGAAIEEITRARARGVKVLAETCPQYLVLTEKDLEGLNMEGAKYVCSPPPRDKPSQDACWAGIERGVFDFYSSDHCPFRYNDEKGKLLPKGRTSFRWVPNGIPGVETRLPILFSYTFP